MFAARFLIRSRRTHRAIASISERRAVVFGAGCGRTHPRAEPVRDPSSSLLPVALLDDDPRKARLFIEGVRVRGTRHDLARVAERYRRQHPRHRCPRAPPRTSFASSRALAAGLRSGDPRPPAGPRDLRRPPDGVGPSQPRRRRPARSPSGRPRHERDRRRDRRPAGARHGGRRLHRLRAVPPDHALRPGPAHHARPRRERRCTPPSSRSRAGRCSTATTWSCATSATSRRCARVVRGAAARRSSSTRPRSSTCTMLERHPGEACKTNVLGTRNVLEAARAVGVETFVNISTDKAADPTCVLGWSKRIAERLTAGFDGRGDGRYVSVRFGNVLGSRGSVVHGVHRADPARGAGHRHPPRRRALLHDHPRGVPARPPGRRHRHAAAR